MHYSLVHSVDASNVSSPSRTFRGDGMRRWRHAKGLRAPNRLQTARPRLAAGAFRQLRAGCRGIRRRSRSFGRMGECAVALALFTRVLRVVVLESAREALP